MSIGIFGFRVLLARAFLVLNEDEIHGYVQRVYGRSVPVSVHDMRNPTGLAVSTVLNKEKRLSSDTPSSIVYFKRYSVRSVFH